ncbi:hypothetical protein BJX61DRAFT_357486 [Aspergillus egyptiacus]|nr:hypothetical protein BJX61DRAFT_357486 [Aspergillus egyptiacus]
MRENEFKCHFPGCTASYRRKEHLGRHQTQHRLRLSFQCPTCGREFGRSDTLRRHVRQVHNETQPLPPKKQACDNCRNLKCRCEGGPPCSECLRRRITCSLDGETPSRESEARQSFPTPPERHPELPSPSPSSSRGHPHRIQTGSFEKERRFLSLYFKLFHPYWPFIHQGSFNEHSETPILVQSMVVIGLWVSGEENARSAAIELHKALGVAIRQQREVWDASIAENASSNCTWPIPMYQALLLHIIFALLRSGGSGSLGLDLKPSLPVADAELLDCLVASCKRLGLLHYPNMLARFSQNDLPSYVWVSIEEVKRFNVALYRICRTLSEQYDRSSIDGRVTDDSSVTGARAQRLSARDLQFPMPRNTPLWNAVSKEVWDAAATEDVFCHNLEDTQEEQWISRSAGTLEAALGLGVSLEIL